MQRAAAVMAFLGCLALRLAFAGDHEAQAEDGTAMMRPSAPLPPSCNRYETISIATNDLDADVRSAIDRTSHFLVQCFDDAEVREIKMHAHLRLGQTDEALVEADEMVRLAPTDPKYFVLRGELAEQTGRDELAASNYREALRLNPAATDVPLKLANVYVRQGHACEASKVLSRASELHPDARRPYAERLARIPCRAAPKTRLVKAPAPAPETPVVLPVNLTAR